jgi:hypothetical protein
VDASSVYNADIGGKPVAYWWHRDFAVKDEPVGFGASL